MNYTAHPQGIKDGLPLISIFDKDGVCVATLTMDDIALLYRCFYDIDIAPFYDEPASSLARELYERLVKQKEKEDD